MCPELLKPQPVFLEPVTQLTTASVNLHREGDLDRGEQGRSTHQNSTDLSDGGLLTGGWGTCGYSHDNEGSPAGPWEGLAACRDSQREGAKVPEARARPDTSVPVGSGMGTEEKQMRMAFCWEH